MMKHRRLVMVLAIGAAGAAAVVACSFPEVTFDSATGDGGGPDTSTNPGDTSVMDGGADVNGDTSLPPDVDPEGGSQEASTYNEAGKIDAAGCNTCDCDIDMWNRDGGMPSASGMCTGGPVSGSTAGFDCDDSDPAINPDAPFFATSSWPSKDWTTTYDWNCDGVVTKQLAYGVTCGPLQIGVNCAAISGFATDVGCGETADFITCKAAALVGCQNDTAKTVKRTQGCR